MHEVRKKVIGSRGISNLSLGRVFVVVASWLLMVMLSTARAGTIPIAPHCPATPVGYWLTYDDKDAQPNGIMQMKMQHGVLAGVLVKVINKPGVKKIARCVKCSGRDHNRVLDGMTLITGMQLKKGTYSGGHIFDPRTATTYKGYVKLISSPCILQVRGYVGFSLLGKTEHWTPLTKSQAQHLIQRKVG